MELEFNVMFNGEKWLVDEVKAADLGWDADKPSPEHLMMQNNMQSLDLQVFHVADDEDDEVKFSYAYELSLNNVRFSTYKGRRGDCRDVSEINGEFAMFLRDL